MDYPESFDHGSVDKLLAYIKEKSDDIEAVRIIPPGSTVTYMGVPVEVIDDFRMMIFLIGDQRKVIFRDAAEALLNDGILNRMKIKIEFMPKPGR